MKYLALIAISILILSSASLADWRYLTADKDFEYRFDTNLVAVYPSVFTEIQLRPVDTAKFRSLIASKRIAAQATGLSLAVRTDCSMSDASSFTEFSALLKNGKKVKLGGVPAAIDIVRLQNSLRARICKQSGSSQPTPRWEPVGTYGKGFEERYVLVDSESIVQHGGFTFWLRVQPKYSVIYAADLDPLKNFNQVESFHHILIRATTDCYDRTIKWDEMRFYGDGDSLLESGDVSGDAESVEPESFTEDLLKFVCSRQRAVKGEQGPHSRDLYLR